MVTDSHQIGNTYKLKGQSRSPVFTLTDIEEAGAAGAFVAFSTQEDAYFKIQAKLAAFEAASPDSEVPNTSAMDLDNMRASRDLWHESSDDFERQVKEKDEQIRSLCRANTQQAERANATIESYQKEVESLRKHVEELTAHISERDRIITNWQAQYQELEDKLANAHGVLSSTPVYLPG